MRYSKIIGTGSYLPATIFTNADWEKRVDTSDAWIVERTGIQSRHFAAPDESAASMATLAAKAALRQANCLEQSVQMIIIATGTPDKIFPATACLVQKNLNIPHCIAFDIQAACTGFIYALSIADQYIKSGIIDCALVIGSEVMSRLIDWTDRNTCVLFGDGAGAVVLKASDAPGILSTHLHAQGQYEDILNLDNPQMAKDRAPCYIKMQGQKLFKVAVAKLNEMVEEIQQHHRLTADQIDWFIPHQANIRIIQASAQKLGLPMEKVICTVGTHSNTSSASIPLALDAGVRDGRIKPDQTLLFEAIGAGLTWGSALVKF